MKINISMKNKLDNTQRDHNLKRIYMSHNKK